MAELHWHAGHNVSGYLPESGVAAVASWDEARSLLMADLEFERDFEDTYGADAETDQAVQDRLGEIDAVIAALSATGESAGGFSACTSTHAGSLHDIPTAWWIEPCREDACAG